MTGFTVFLLVIGAATVSAAAVLGPLYLSYKLDEWGRKRD